MEKDLLLREIHEETKDIVKHINDYRAGKLSVSSSSAVDELNSLLSKFIGLYNQLSSGQINAAAAETSAKALFARSSVLKGRFSLPTSYWDPPPGNAPIILDFPVVTPEVPKPPAQSSLPMVSQAPVYDEKQPNRLDDFLSTFFGGVSSPDVKAEVVNIPDEVRQIQASPDPVAALTTPRAGTVPVAAGTSNWADLIATIFGGVSQYKQQELKRELVKLPYLYVTPETQQYVAKKRLPWGWIGGGLGLAVLAGVGIYLWKKK